MLMLTISDRVLSSSGTFSGSLKITGVAFGPGVANLLGDRVEEPAGESVTEAGVPSDGLSISIDVEDMFV